MSSQPIQFNEFFDMGLEDHLSPFLTSESRKWGFHLSLKTSITALILLIGAYALYLHPLTTPLAYFCLLGVYFFAGVPALIESIEDVVRLQINIDVLMTLAAFSSVLIGSPFEGGLLLVLFALSGAMESAVTDKAKGAINALYKLSPSTALLVLPTGELRERSVKDIEVGSHLLIRAGDLIPLDGRILEGATSLNLVHLTGESLPVKRSKGEEVPAGAQNLEGSITIEVTHTSEGSTVARIIRLVTEAQAARPKIQKLFDRLSEPYALTIIGLSAFFALTLPWLSSIPYFGYEGGIYRAVAFLIAASPCALIIATPTAYLSAISACARKGVLLKGGITLDAIAASSIVALDKTGTLTRGILECTLVSPEHERGLSIALALERGAKHPIAKAILKYGEAKNIAPHPIENFIAVPGYGIQAQVRKEQTLVDVYLGNPDFILPKIDRPEQKKELEKKVEEAHAAGEILALLLIEKEEVVLFRFTDVPREEAKGALDELKSLQIRLMMLTGDHARSAERIAKSMGITEVYANLKPEDKLQYVTTFSRTDGLAMVGDGVNDAPALARATVGISLGKEGSNAAIEAADVVLLHDNLDTLPWLFRKAKQTERIVHQNLTLAAGVILLATTPALLGYIPLWLAVVLHEGGTVLVGLNALRLTKTSTL